MLIGATVLCFLVLMALIAERIGVRFWHNGVNRAFYRCDACDLRYPRAGVNAREAIVCPEGHLIAREESGTPAGLVAVMMCLGFLTVALTLLLTGVVR